jgi:gliding motility-associated-like protein
MATGSDLQPVFLAIKNNAMYFGGNASGNGYPVVKINMNGTLDSAFGQAGKLQISGANGTVYSGAVSHDGKLLVGTQDGTFPYLYKVQSKSVLHIIGNENVLPNTAEKYSIKIPSGLTLNYTWIYTGQNFAYTTSTTTSSVSIYFTESATSGQLKCVAKAVTGAPYDTVRLNIKVNYNSTPASQLTKSQCSNQLTDCNMAYIENFTLNHISNSFTGCSGNGFTDYTRSGKMDSLILGGAYSAKLTVLGSNQMRHAAIWIDYNNDGIFSADDFVGGGYSTNSDLLINNLILKNRDGYDGPKRLRVRCRNINAFKPEDACQGLGEQGEVEDYLVVITRQGVLSAPQIITPNEDGKNDYFVVRGIQPDVKNHLVIFDRVGEVKFSALNYENNWNGMSSSGEKLLPGTYYYLFTNDDEFIRGFVEIRY